MRRDIELSRGYMLSIDSRDIPLPASIRKEVWDWSQNNDIFLEGHKYGIEGWDIWRVRDDEQRVRFILRWL